MRPTESGSKVQNYASCQSCKADLERRNDSCPKYIDYTEENGDKEIGIDHKQLSGLIANCYLKRMLQGKRFGSNEEVIAETGAYFEAKDKSFYIKGIGMLEKRPVQKIFRCLIYSYRNNNCAKLHWKNSIAERTIFWCSEPENIAIKPMLRYGPQNYASIGETAILVFLNVILLCEGYNFVDMAI